MFNKFHCSMNVLTLKVNRFVPTKLREYRPMLTIMEFITTNNNTYIAKNNYHNVIINLFSRKNSPKTTFCLLVTTIT